MGNFHLEMKQLKQQMAVQSAETLARLKKIEGDLADSIGQVTQQMQQLTQQMQVSLRDGFSRFEEALDDQHKAHTEAIDRLIDQVETFLTDELKNEIAEEAVHRVQTGLLVRLEELQIRLERLERGSSAA